MLFVLFSIQSEQTICTNLLTVPRRSVDSNVYARTKQWGQSAVFRDPTQ